MHNQMHSKVFSVKAKIISKIFEVKARIIPKIFEKPQPSKCGHVQNT